MASELQFTGKVSGSVAAGGLMEGDVIRVKVLFSEGENVQLQTPDGQIIKGRLEGDVFLMQGQEVLLAVTERTEDVICLAIARGGDQTAKATRAEVAAMESDGRLAPLVNALRQQGLPVTRQTVETMVRLLQDHPDMPLEEAAFLAANQIDGEQAVPGATRPLLEGEVKTGDLLLQLSELFAAGEGKGDAVAKALEALLSPEGRGVEARLEGAAILARNLLGDKNITLPQAGEIRTLAEGQSGQAIQDAVEPNAGSLPGQPVTEETLDLHPMQPEAALAQAASEQTGAEPRPLILHGAAQDAPQPGQPAPLAGGQTLEAGPAPAGQGPEALPGPKPPSAPVPGPDVQEDETARASQPAKVPPAPASGLLQELGKVLEFERLGTARTQEFVSMVERAADEVTAALSGKDPAGGLKGFLDKLFADVTAWEEKTPSLLRQAREELFLRLSLVRETLQQTDLQTGKAQLMEQTQKLMDHVKLMGEIQQYVCAQIPIQLNGEQTTCELYVYQNKKGRRKIDPENARILLALDLSHLGRLQALVGVTGKEVSIRFEVEQEKGVDFIRGQTVGLHAMLAGSGYKLAETKVALLKREATPGNALLALGEYENGKTTGIDYTV